MQTSVWLVLRVCLVLRLRWKHFLSLHLLCMELFGVSDSELLEFLLFMPFPGRKAGFGVHVLVCK